MVELITIKGSRCVNGWIAQSVEQWYGIRRVQGSTKHGTGTAHSSELNSHYPVILRNLRMHFDIAGIKLIVMVKNP
jgi:hypothetical protein